MGDSLTVSKLLDMMASIPPAPPPTTIVKTHQFPGGRSWKIVDDDGSVWFFMNEADLARLPTLPRTLEPTADQLLGVSRSFSGVPVVDFDGRAREVFLRALARLANTDSLV